MKLKLLFIWMSISAVSPVGQAEDLMRVYQQARENNPELRQSAALRDAAFEKINQARSILLPQLQLGTDYIANHGLQDDHGVNSTTYSGSLQLTQTLFDRAKWRALTLQEKQAALEDVAFRAQYQQLILDTAKSYFDVLRAKDSLGVIKAQKISIERQLDQTTERYRSGLAAVTDVHNARAQYDSVLADEVNSENELDNAKEKLRQVTGNDYNALASLNIDDFTTSTPDPADLVLKLSESRNLHLLSARLKQDTAREQIRLAESGHLPTLSLKASSGLSKNSYSGSRGLYYPDSETGSNKIGLSLSVPLFQGGGVASQVKQAQFAFVAASEQLESVHRSIVQQVRSSSSNVRATISSINAYTLAVVSATSSLEAMEVGYQVGTRTIVDVLDATSTLYNAQQRLSGSRYDYLINTLMVKQAQGTLNEQDLMSLNRMLGKEVATAESLNDR